MKVWSGCRPNAAPPAGSSARERGGAAGVADERRGAGHAPRRPPRSPRRGRTARSRRSRAGPRRGRAGPRRRRPAARSARLEAGAQAARSDDAHAGDAGDCHVFECILRSVHSALWVGSGRHRQGYPSPPAPRLEFMQPRSAQERREALVELYQEARALYTLPAASGPHPGRIRRRQRRRRPDVRRRGARPAGGPPGHPVRGPGRQAARPAAGRGRPGAGRRVHHERAQEPPAGQPRPAARGDRRLQAVPAQAGRADRAARDLHARQLRHEAADPLAARHHERPRPPAGARAGRARGARVPDLPPGGGAAQHEDARGAARGLPRACPRCSRSRRRCPIGAVAPVAAVAAEPAPEPPQINLFD